MIDLILYIIFVVLAVFFIIFVGLSVFMIPAMVSLPRGMRPGIESLTIENAAMRLRKTGKSGDDLVEAARALVGERMQYCRRNSFDCYDLAFERGYGYCQQSAFALADLLKQLGFDAKVVNAFRNQFPDGKTGGHAWVQVGVGEKVFDVDPMFYEPGTRSIIFLPLTKVFPYSPVFRLFAGWGSAVVNAYRYYFTGVDR